MALCRCGYDIEGIDYAQSTVERIRRVAPELRVRCGDIYALPYDDGALGAYISIGLLEHAAQGPAAGLREARRVLRLQLVEPRLDVVGRGKIVSSHRLHARRQQQEDVPRVTLAQERLDRDVHGVPLPGLDHVASPHVREGGLDTRRGHLALSDRTDLLDARFRFRQLASLEIAVLHPRERMKVAFGIG